MIFISNRRSNGGRWSEIMFCTRTDIAWIARPSFVSVLSVAEVVIVMNVKANLDPDRRLGQLFVS
jgi:hypothetical protein